MLVYKKLVEKSLLMNKFKISVINSNVNITVQDQAESTTDFIVQHEVAILDKDSHVSTLHVTDDLGAEYSFPLINCIVCKLAH